MIGIKKLSAATGSALSTFASAGVKARGATKLAVDGLVADGIVVDDLKSPGADGDRTFYDSALSFIMSGMSRDDQKLMAAKPGDLTEASKAKRNDALRVRSSLLGDLRKALKRRLDSMDKGAQKQWTLAMRIQKRLDEIRDMCKNAEEAPFDITKVLTGVGGIEKLIK
jgi:hypothetical protein